MLLLTSRPEKVLLDFGRFPIAAIALLCLSIVVLMAYHRSFAHTLASLGWMTLVPGIGALVMMIVNREAVVSFLVSLVSVFGNVGPYVSAYIDAALPKVWVFIGVYIFLGFVLLYVAGKIEYEHAMMATLKRVFGPRARIYRK
jgi:hypothetical protein